MAIQISGRAIDRRLQSRIVTLVGATLEGIRGPVQAQVTFFDENGPKGGRDIRCAFTVSVPRRPTIRVEHQAETPRLAFDGGFAALERSLNGDAERRRDLRRRPKKYFTAKRLLAPEAAPAQGAE
jgi:ribosome-associated translation inhibitor RaiA